jgi:replicative DNA helicase
MEKFVNKELTTISALIKDEDMPSFLQAPADIFEQYGDVYEFLIDYYQGNRGLPPKNIVERKFNVKLEDEVGSTRHHVEELRNTHLKKRMREILRETAQKLQDGELISAMSIMVSATSSLKKDTTDIRDVDATDVDSAVDHIESVKALNALGRYGVTFDIPGIDDFLPSGVVPGMFGLMLGYPGRGKSFLTTLMAVRAWKANKKVLYVSLEMLESEVRSRFYCVAGDGHWSLRDLQRGNIDTEAFRVWANEALEERDEFPIISNNGNGKFTPSTLRAKIEEYRPDIVFVDYLQLMAPDGADGSNETVRLKTLSTELKMMCTGMRVAIVGVVSATPTDASDMDSIPELGQVAWSKQLAYDCDWMLAVGRADNSPMMGVAWRKNRNGPLSDFGLECDFNRGVFKHVELDFDSDG